MKQICFQLSQPHFLFQQEKLPPYGRLFSSFCGELQPSAANSEALRAHFFWYFPADIFRQIFFRNFFSAIFSEFILGNYFGIFFCGIFFWEFFLGKFLSRIFFFKIFVWGNIFLWKLVLENICFGKICFWGEIIRDIFWGGNFVLSFFFEFFFLEIFVQIYVFQIFFF